MGSTQAASKALRGVPDDVEQADLIVFAFSWLRMRHASFGHGMLLIPIRYLVELCPSFES